MYLFINTGSAFLIYMIPFCIVDVWKFRIIGLLGLVYVKMFLYFLDKFLRPGKCFFS